MSKGVSKVGRAIDWDYLNKVVVSADGKRHLQALRRAYDDVAITIADKFSMVRIIYVYHMFLSVIQVTIEAGVVQVLLCEVSLCVCAFVFLALEPVSCINEAQD